MPGQFANRVVRALVESPLHSLMGDRLGVIQVVGRVTGRTYATPVNVDREGPGWMVTSLRERTWWRNLRAGAHAKLRLAGRTCAVQASVEERPEAVLEGLTAYFGRHPREARYFGVRLDAAGRPAREDLERAAAKRVIIRLAEIKDA